MNIKMRCYKSGMTLIELSISLSLSVFLFAGVFLISKNFSSGSQKSMDRLETCLEAKKILRILRVDLYNACRPIGKEAFLLNFSGIVSESGAVFSPQYEWFAFPSVKMPDKLISSDTSGFLVQKISRIKYFLKPLIDGNNSSQMLIREEIFHSDFKIPPNQMTVSRQIHFLQIKPIEVHDSSGDKQSLFQIILQLSETPGENQLSTNATLEFTELVSPVFWRTFCKKEYPGRNWNYLLEGP
ncbi:MAG: hypothetical protein HQM08_27925 [Candidatus Riflebacteria bacterium]|nr:hypothetical protein [Candidatus Riflebacteria bacterium]